MAERDRRNRISRAVAPGWERAIEAYLTEARRQNLSVTTIQQIKDVLLGSRAREFLALHPIGSVQELDRDMLRAYELTLRSDGLKPSTIATHHRRWKTFARFCAQEGWLDGAGDLLGMKGPIIPSEAPATITKAQERTLIESARCARDRFLIRFVTRTGLRRSEICSLTTDDILDGGVLRVRQGKGRKDRGVPLDTGGCRFSAELDAYVRNVRPQSVSRGLFLTTVRFEGQYTPLKPQGLYMVFRRLSEQTGIHVYPHKLRHTFGTRSAQAGVRELMLQQALGHTTLKMVERYVHHSTADLVEAWSRRRD